MKVRTAINILMAFVLASTSASSFAGQGSGQGGGGGHADHAQQADRDRTYDHDRMQDRARIDVPQQDRDRDRTHIQDPSKMKDQDIYGNELMSDSERKQYREELGNHQAQGSHQEFQAQHENQMQQRALAQGQDLVPPGQGPVYGGELMSVQERNEYRERLRLAGSEEESQKLQAQHREQMQERAHALNLEVEEAE